MIKGQLIELHEDGRAVIEAVWTGTRLLNDAKWNQGRKQ